jgi:hypothetical protein
MLDWYILDAGQRSGPRVEDVRSAGQSFPSDLPVGTFTPGSCNIHLSVRASPPDTMLQRRAWHYSSPSFATGLPMLVCLLPQILPQIPRRERLRRGQLPAGAGAKVTMPQPGWGGFVSMPASALEI